MTKHTIFVRKPFKITNRAGDLIKLPTGYKLTGISHSYTDESDLKEKTNFVCDKDGVLIAEMTEIRGLEWNFVHYKDDDDLA